LATESLYRIDTEKGERKALVVITQLQQLTFGLFVIGPERGKGVD
jgi:hypothetical protein